MAINANKIVEFSRKGDQSRRGYAQYLRANREQGPITGGGDYWVISSSAIQRYYKEDDEQIISDKINEFETKITDDLTNQTRVMYERNVDILSNFEGYNFTPYKPEGNLRFLPKPRNFRIIRLFGLDVKVSPSVVFSFGNAERTSAGAIWFVSKLGGYNFNELAFFADALHGYMDANYSADHDIDSRYCIALDLINQRSVNYHEVETNERPSPLEGWIDEINSY